MADNGAVSLFGCIYRLLYNLKFWSFLSFKKSDEMWSNRLLLMAGEKKMRDER